MKRIWIIILSVLLVSVLSDFLLYRDNAHEWWQSIPGFFAIFGLAFCVIIIVVSKLLGHLWLQQREDYYDRDRRSG